MKLYLVRFWEIPLRVTICVLLVIFILFRQDQRWKHGVLSLLVCLIYLGILELMMMEFLKLEACENIMLLTLFVSVLDLLLKNSAEWGP